MLTEALLAAGCYLAGLATAISGAYAYVTHVRRTATRSLDTIPFTFAAYRLDDED